MSEPTVRRFIATTLFAAALASGLNFGVTLLVQTRSQAKERENLAIALRESISDEVDRAKQVIDSIKLAVAATTSGKAMPIEPTGFSMLHSPAVYYDVRPKIFVLTPATISAVAHFDFRLSDVRVVRDLFLKGLVDAKGDIVKAGTADAYVVFLGGLIKDGDAVLDAIRTGYPDLPPSPPSRPLMLEVVGKH
jgi:hypothetical protein